MTAHAYPGLLALGEGHRHSIGTPARWTLATSFALHLFLLVVITFVTLPHRVERPASSYQVSLVTLQTVAAKPMVDPVPQQPQQVQQPVKPPIPEAVPPPTQRVPSAHVRPEAPKPSVIAKLPPLPLPAARKPSEAGQNLMKDVLRGIELPPEAPRLADASAPSPPVVDKPNPKPPEREIEKMISKLTVPEIQTRVPVVPITEPALEPMTRQSVLEELEKIERQLQAVQTPAPVPTQPSSAKLPEAAPPASRTTLMRIEGLATGSNSYFSRIQGLVSRHWAPPKVDLGGREPKVVIRFRLHRSGAVSDVAIESSSGNDYYDAAGKRAILSAAAAQLPPFPSGLGQAYVDVNFSFGVEQTAG
jgi:colicin import membrane protein